MDRPQPVNIQLERYIVGSLVIENDKDIITKTLSQIILDDFTDKFCVKIIRLIINIMQKGNKADIIALCPLLKHTEEAEILKLTANITSTALIEQRVFELKEITARRKSINLMLEYTDRMYQTDELESDLERLSESIGHIKATISVKQASINAASVDTENPIQGILSGFITHDYNDSGLKAGGLTILTGAKGMGKTTMSRQIIVSCAMQKIKSYIFIGESSMGVEKRSMAKLGSLKGEIHVELNEAGRSIYTPKKEAIDRFNNTHAEYISMSDVDMFPGDIFRRLFKDMIDCASAGTKLFVLDSLMVLVSATGKKVFSEQKKITQTLKNFAKRFNCHVVLIAHPNSGGDRISGAEEIGNLCDTILCYHRLTDKEKTKCPKGFNQDHWESISAVIFNRKIRDEGTQKPAWLTWSAEKGAVYDVSDLPKAIDFESKGYWTKAIHRIPAEDVPTGNMPYKDN